jgi:hypothetical protein
MSLEVTPARTVPVRTEPDGHLCSARKGSSTARFKILLILLCVGALVAASGSAVAVSPQWRGTPAPAAVKPAPQRFEMQCPSAYAGLKGELLPTYWQPVDKGQQVSLVKSQVRGDSLYCVYRMAFAGREIHASVRRMLPSGYTCESDGAGRFECRKK